MADQAQPVAMGGAFVEDAEAQARFVAHKRYLAWRRRLLPVVAVVAFLLLWWQAVVQFDIKPFIAPSPVAVAEVLVQRFDMLMANLLPTAIEAICGFALGNFAAISLATTNVTLPHEHVCKSAEQMRVVWIRRDCVAEHRLGGFEIAGLR